MTDIGVPDEEDLASTNKSYIIEKTKQELSAAGRDVRNMSDEELESSAKAVADRIGTKISAKDFGPRFSVQRDKQQGISFKREKDFNIGQQVRGMARMQEPPQAFFEKVPEAIADAISRINQQRITGASVVSEKERQDVTSEQLEDRTVPKKFTRIPEVKPKVPEPSIDKDEEKIILSSLQEEMNKQKDEEPTTTENLTLKTLAEEMQKLQANKTTETKEVEEETKQTKATPSKMEPESRFELTEYEKISKKFSNNPKSLTNKEIIFLINTTKGTSEERQKAVSELNKRPKKNVFSEIAKFLQSRKSDEPLNVAYYRK
tara:strand:+ start:541 stop:1494 length:954 start_codon:yes stop_codon:yes gene_type:complete